MSKTKNEKNNNNKHFNINESDSSIVDSLKYQLKTKKPYYLKDINNIKKFLYILLITGLQILAKFIYIEK